MHIGMTVMRKTDEQAGVAIFGVIDSLAAGRASVHWTVSQNGGTRRGGNGHHSLIRMSALIEVTPEIRANVLERQRLRAEEKKRLAWAARPYVCRNINPAARVANDGHSSPLTLMESQVVNGCCYYCSAPVFKRCMAFGCTNDPIEGSTFCSWHAGDVRAALSRAQEDRPCH